MSNALMISLAANGVLAVVLVYAVMCLVGAIRKVERYGSEKQILNDKLFDFDLELHDLKQENIRLRAAESKVERQRRHALAKAQAVNEAKRAAKVAA